MPACTLNVAEVEPCGIITVEGTLATVGLELESETATPPIPAGALRLMVPLPDWSLRIKLGRTEMLVKALVAAGGGLMVTTNVLLIPA